LNSYITNCYRLIILIFFISFFQKGFSQATGYGTGPIKPETHLEKIVQEPFDSTLPNQIYFKSPGKYYYHKHLLTDVKMYSLFKDNPEALSYFNKSLNNQTASSLCGSIFIISGISSLFCAFAAKEATKYFLGGMGMSLVLGVHFENREWRNKEHAICIYNQTH